MNRTVPTIITLAIITLAVMLGGLGPWSAAAEVRGELPAIEGQMADVAPSAYEYRADRSAEDNSPESWILLIQYAGLSYDKPVDVDAPAIKKVLGGLLWE
ncbi:hypothetical protein LCGC14_2339600, partial [marine sediment metagenome]